MAAPYDRAAAQRRALKKKRDAEWEEDIRRATQEAEIREQCDFHSHDRCENDSICTCECHPELSARERMWLRKLMRGVNS